MQLTFIELILGARQRFKMTANVEIKIQDEENVLSKVSHLQNFYWLCFQQPRKLPTIQHKK